MKFKKPFIPVAVGIAAVAVTVLVVISVGGGARAAVQPEGVAAPSGGSIPSEACLECHRTPGMVLPLGNGEFLNLTVTAEDYEHSTHWEAGYVCVDCHTNITGYPHPDFSAVDRRDVSIKLAQTCTQCHQDEAEAYSQGRHAKEFAKGNLNTALCVDCHTAHSVTNPSASKRDIAQVCRQCHSDIYDKYAQSVHGAALLKEGNADVPVCTDCHENHDNTGPDDPGYVLFSPQICARCHTDEALMSKYGIKTNVFDTYVADFHGTTVQIFEQVAPDQETNKPVCIDCHGVHDILPPDNAASTVMKDNLLATCQRCHPTAKNDFPDAWLMHYTPDLHQNTLVYMVNLFYMVVIPSTVVGLGVFIGSDVFRSWRDKLKRKSGSKKGAQHDGK